MKKSNYKKFLFAAGIACLAVCILGTPRVFGDDELDRNPSNRTWAAVEISSDPPGAYVYGDDGSYWGQTAKDEPLVRIFWHDSRKEQQSSGYYSPDPNYTKNITLSLKKRGYKKTDHTFTVRYKYRAKDKAEENPQKLTILLDDE